MSACDASLTVDDLLAPNVPARVRGRYLSLAERAKLTAFGSLEEDIVMLDTETTGLSFRKNELIEIAAARISGADVVARFQTFVHPTGPIPAEIQVLTGITNLDVADAPQAADAVAALSEFVQGLPVVAHNATFDRTFIESVPGGRGVSDVWIDSLALSRIALPLLTSHRLSDMAEAFGCAAVTHRAMADVDALCGMWRILLLGLSDLPAGLLGELSSMHEDVSWAYRPLFKQLALESYGAKFSLRDHRRQLMGEVCGARRVDAAELARAHPEHFVARDLTGDVRAAFAPDGIVSGMYDAYEQRPEQLSMAMEVAEAQATSTQRAIEAGTGVGKSMAYLLPSVLFARENDVTVGVATKTNALTDQLVAHELPALAEALPGGVEFVSVKGYDHYPCLHRLGLAGVRELPVGMVEHDGRSDDAVAQDMLNAIAVTSSYACQAAEGDVDALGIRWRYVPRALLTTTPSECLRGRCPFYPNECFVHGARRRAGCADVVVTNHSMLLRDIAFDGAILPPIRHWVVDEAHSFEQEARRQWAQELSADAAQRAFLTLGGIKSGVLHSLMARSARLDASTLVARLLTKSASTVQRASVASADLMSALHGLIALAPSNGGYDNTTLWISQDVRATDGWRVLELVAAKAYAALEEATKALDETQAALAPESAQMAAELGEATKALRELAAALDLIVLNPDESYVYSAELWRAKRRMGRDRLTAEKLDVGADLASRWYPETMSVTYTSATIAVGESFEHFEHAVGLDELDPAHRKTLKLDSGFDYDRHMGVIVARDMPEPNERDYLGALEDLLFDVHVAMEGSVLTLFTNRREMERVYQALRPRLTDRGLDLACQERGLSARRVSERFLSDEALSLFALKSFWEGFDAAGDTLRCVVIPKLPFASPSDPLVRERDFREQRAWWRYSLPEAVLSVKQAAGRLIRTNTDSGLLILADSRVASKRYGRTFLRSLPTQDHVMLECSNVARYLTMWRAAH